ncbi:MAG TPA: ATP-dependent Clp protease proteolytic subunit [Candidatus Woesebacteria bacterium]|nr:ATP-dependent Clp protease proteolytic subunit [Candidatus Woesebacteria bacterium]
MQTYNIYLFGEITYETAQTVMSGIDSANANDEYSDILLIICSYGGYNLPAFALYEKISSSQKEITTKATGTCQSSAVVVLQAGHKRLATEKTIFMLHQIDSPIQNPTFSELQKESEHMKRMNDLFIELTVSKSNITKEDFEKQTKNTLYLSAQEAFSQGFIDEIIQ